jgi:hypothetical protein
VFIVLKSFAGHGFDAPGFPQALESEADTVWLLYIENTSIVRDTVGKLDVYLFCKTPTSQ